MHLPSFFKRGRARWLLLAALVVAVGGGFWLWQRSQTAEEVTTVQPQVRTLTQVLEFSGVTNASERVAQRFAVGGRLTYVGGKEGDFVKKWQTLASIDARSAQKALEQQLNAYESQRLTFETQEDDRKDRVLETEEARTAQQEQLALEDTVLGVEIQSLAIQDTRLYSPIEGILIQAPDAVSGTTIGATDVFEVFNPQTTYFQAYVDEIDVANVFVGQPAKIRLDSFSGQEFEGTVQKIAYQSMATSNGATVFPIHIHFDTGIDRSLLRLGMNGEAELIIEERTNVLSIPIEAVTTRDGKNFVSLRVGEETQEREVALGLETDDYAEVLSGLSESDEVVLP